MCPTGDLLVEFLSGCVYSPQPATCLVESCRWGYSGCAYSPQQASCLSSLLGGVIVGVHSPQPMLSCCKLVTYY